MSNDWNADDRRTIKHIGLWLAVLLSGMVVRGMITEVGNTEVALCLTLSALWLIFATWVVVRTVRQWMQSKKQRDARS